MKRNSYYRRKIMNWLLPYCCILCNAKSNQLRDICESCLNDFPLLDNPCPRCAKPLAHPGDFQCGDCLKITPPFDTTLALFAYKQPLPRLIMQLKFNHLLINARLLGELLAKAIHEKQRPLPDVVIPVPLHALRLKERGFNQGMEIARPIVQQLNLILDNTSCLRQKFTAPQATLPATDRLNNIKNAFQVNQDFSGQHIAVIDDVITTGFTVTEFCKTLKKAGAKTIDVWCCARAIPLMF